MAKDRDTLLHIQRPPELSCVSLEFIANEDCVGEGAGDRGNSDGLGDSVQPELNGSSGTM